jgi:hypothetical protein
MELVHGIDADSELTHVTDINGCGPRGRVMDVVFRQIPVAVRG